MRIRLQTSNRASSFTPARPQVLQRKCACGGTPGLAGECESCRRKKLQRKLTIGPTNDPLEQEADRVADQVTAAPRYSAISGTPLRIQCHPTNAIEGTATLPASVNRVLATSGRSLEPALRQEMEQRFGYDFSRVRVHSDAAAAQSARDVSANAYTVGQSIVFGASQFAPATPSGRRLLAHELTHVVQQSDPEASGTIMRKGFESTVKVCHNELESRKFQVENGGVRVVLVANSPDFSVVNCEDFDFGVTLTRSEDWWPDNRIGSCEATTGGTRSFLFANIPAGTYYLTIWRSFDHPYCCLEGDILVFDEAVSSDSPGCQRDKDLSAMDIVHGALDIAGFFPGLGAIPDGINAILYMVEGDWANAGLSAVAMVPLWGDGVKLATVAGKSVIKISSKAAVKLGPKGIAKGLQEVKAASKAAGAAEEAVKATKLEKEVAEGLTTEAAGKLEKEAAAKIEKGAAEKASKKRPSDAKKEKPEANDEVTEKSKKKEKDGKVAAMRFQVQWGTREGGPTFGLPAVAPWSTGVVTAQAITVLSAVMALVEPNQARLSAVPAYEKQVKWILKRPPAGIGVSLSQSEYFRYKSYTDARVDVENLRGHNLKK